MWCSQLVTDTICCLFKGCVRCMQHRNASFPACYPQVVDNFVDNYVNMLQIWHLLANAIASRPGVR